MEELLRQVLLRVRVFAPPRKASKPKSASPKAVSGDKVALMQRVSMVHLLFGLFWGSLTVSPCSVVLLLDTPLFLCSGVAVSSTVSSIAPCSLAIASIPPYCEAMRRIPPPMLGRKPNMKKNCQKPTDPTVISKKMTASVVRRMRPPRRNQLFDLKLAISHLRLATPVAIKWRPTHTRPVRKDAQTSSPMNSRLRLHPAQ